MSDPKKMLAIPGAVDELPIPDAQDATDDGAPPPAATPTSRTESFFRGAGNAASFGLGDEAAGMGAKLYNLFSGEDEIPRAAGRGINAPLSNVTDYDVARDQERDLNKRASDDNPGTYLAGQVTGGIATSAVPIARAAAPAATTALKLAQAMKGGALAGGLYGFGESEADNGADRFADTLVGAETGAVLGPAATALGTGVEKGYRYVRDRTPTTEMLKGLLDRAGFGPSIKTGPSPSHLTRDQVNNVRAAYGPERAAAGMEASANTAEGKSLRELAARGSDPKAVETHAEDIRQRLAELAGDTSAATRGADPKIQEAYAREIDDKLTRLWANSDKIKWEEDIGKKGELVTKLLAHDAVDADDVIRRADDMAQRLEIQLHDLYGYVSPGTPDHSIITKVLKEVSEYKHGTPAMAKRKNLAAITGYDVAGDKFLALDQVKRELQKSLDSARSRGDSLIIEEVDRLSEGLRDYLQDPNVWGEGSAALQAIRNQGWRERLLMRSKKGDPNRIVMSDATYEPSLDKYRPAMKGDPSGLMHIVRNVDDYASSTDVRALREYANREAKLLEALTNHVEPDPDLVARAAEAKQLAQEINKILDQRSTEAGAASMLDETGVKLASDPGKLLGLVKNADQYGSGPELQALRQWAMAQAAKPDASKRSKQLVQEIDQILRSRVQEAKAAQLIGDIGQPLPLPEPGLMRRGAEQLPVVGPLMQQDRQVPNLQQQAQLLGQLEKALGIDPNNPAAKEAMRRIFGQVEPSNGTFGRTVFPNVAPRLAPQRDERR